MHDRTILYRAYSKRWSKMIYSDDREFRISLANGDGPHTIWKDLCNEEGVRVGFFTGLRDKNKQPIYEGDILKAIDGVVFVFYNDATASFDIEHLGGDNDSLSEWTEALSDFVEIIGNMDENEELFEEQ